MSRETRLMLARLADWTLPPRIQGVVRRVLRHALPPTPRAPTLPANLSLRNRHAGQRIFVIGNGPSLKGMDLAPLGREITIGANSFYKHPQAQQVALKFLCIGDADFMKVTPETLAWHRTLDEQHPNAVFLAEPGITTFQRDHGLHQTQEVHFFHTGPHAHRLEDVQLDLAYPLTVGQMTGSLLAIPLALYLGAREIYLLGFDLNHHIDPGKSYHFYNKHEQFPEFDSMAADRRFDYEKLLGAMHREFESHRLLRLYAESKGVSIFNATRGGMLDVYPRVQLESVLEGRA